MQTLIAEDLLLLLLDDAKGTLAASDKVQPLLGGALLLELALAGRVGVAERTSRWNSAKVAVTGTPPGEPLLDEAMARVAEKPRTAQDLVNRLGKGTRDVLLDRLAARGLVERRDGKVLGLFPHTTWPARDARHEESVRALLQGALVQGLTPDARTSALVALLAAIDHAHKVVDRGRPARPDGEGPRPGDRRRGVGREGGAGRRGGGAGRDHGGGHGERRRDHRRQQLIS